MKQMIWSQERQKLSRMTARQKTIAMEKNKSDKVKQVESMTELSWEVL
jgi:hypothetical protein